MWGSLLWTKVCAQGNKKPATTVQHSSSSRTNDSDNARSEEGSMWCEDLVAPVCVWGRFSTLACYVPGTLLSAACCSTASLPSPRSQKTKESSIRSSAPQILTK